MALSSGCAAGLDPNAGQERPESELESSADALGGVNLAGENLGGANLGGSNLGGANLGGANLGGTNLGGTNLGGNNLGGTNLGGNNLGGNNLGGTNLGGTNLGGTNLGGTNLGGTNLGGSNLGGSNLAGSFAGLGCPIAGTTRLGTDLALTTVGTDIHNLGGTVASKLLKSGEDVYARNNACVVLGIGSTAFAKLVSQNLVSGGGTLYAAIRKTTWGFSQTANGAIALSAWEVVVWGANKYSVFILASPTTTSWEGVAGFVKALFRWNAPPAMTLKIGQIGGGKTVQTHTGMMNAQAQILGGVIDERTYVGGQLVFAAATTNNVSVMVDFASWVGKKTTNDPVVLGRPDANLNHPDAVYSLVLRDDGQVAPIAGAFGRTRVGSNFLSDAYDAWKAGLMGKPSPKRCYDAFDLNRWHPTDYPTPTDKCDAFALTNLAIDTQEVGALGTAVRAEGFAAWSTAPTSSEFIMMHESNNGTPDFKVWVSPGVAGCSSSSPSWSFKLYEGNYCKLPVLSQTYVNFIEPPFSVAGEGASMFVARRAIVDDASAPVTISVDITNVGTVPGTTWTLTLSDFYDLVSGEGADQTISGLAVGATVRKTFTVTPRQSPSKPLEPTITLVLRKGSQNLASYKIAVTPKP